MPTRFAFCRWVTKIPKDPSGTPGRVPAIDRDAGTGPDGVDDSPGPGVTWGVHDGDGSNEWSLVVVTAKQAALDVLPKDDPDVIWIPNIEVERAFGRQDRNTKLDFHIRRPIRTIMSGVEFGKLQSDLARAGVGLGPITEDSDVHDLIEMLLKKTQPTNTIQGLAWLSEDD